MDQQYKERGALINRQIKEIAGIYRDMLRRLGISDSEFWIWYALVADKGGHTQQDICSMWSLPKQTVNTIITRLRLKKYAYLEAVPGTRNHKIVRLTPAGRAYGERLILPIAQAEGQAFSRISSDELSAVTDIIDKYIGIIKQELDRVTE